MTPSSPLRILHVVEASFAGVGRHVSDLVDGLAAAGDEVHLAYGTARADAPFLARLSATPATTVLPLATGRQPDPRDLAALARLRRHVARHGPYDVVHGHASKGGLLARLLTGSARRVYTPNAFVTQAPTLGRASRSVYAAAERLLARRTHGLVVVSPEEQAHAAELRLRPRHVRLVPNGIPFPPLPDMAGARRELGLPPPATVVGFVGRLAPQKGVDLLLDAFARLPARPDLLLAVVGDGADGPELRARGEALGLGTRVRWLGEAPGQRAMAAFDVLAVPSRYEGFPYVVLEGLWAGLPVLATRTSGTEAVLGAGTTGVLVDPTVDAVAGALGRLVDDPAHRAAIAAHARAAVAPFTVGSMVEATRAFYLDLLREARRG